MLRKQFLNTPFNLGTERRFIFVDMLIMKKFRVVVIDDVEDILDLIVYNLSKEGMEVEAFSDSAEALQHIMQSPPDIVLSDWMMPGMDGLEVCRRIHNSPVTCNVPVVMLTCRGSIKDYREANEAGARDYVVKPVRMEELIRRVKLLLPHRGRQLTFGK